MKLKKKALAIVSCMLAAVLTIGVTGCHKGDESYNPTGPVAPVESNETYNVKNSPATEITGGYEKGTARAVQTSEYLGAVDAIVKPVKDVVDEHETYGVTQYPYYGRNLKTSINNRDAIYWESISLLPQPTWRSRGIYNGIDAEGYLLKNGQRILYNANDGSDNDEEEEGEIIAGDESLEGEEEAATGSTSINKQFNEKYRMLYKHTAAITMYGGGLSDDEPRIIKKITAFTHPKLASTNITGLYAPAGEVIKIEMSEAEYKAAGGLAVYIGQNYNLDQQVAVEFTSSGVKGNGFTRMTDILSKFELRDAYHNVTIENGIATAYVGSFLGGPIYFRPLKNDVERKVSVTISGAVKYQHFILGVTTPEEYEFNKTSTAPYFDLEVYDSVRFTTHKFASSGGLALKDYTYENCTDAAILWDKIAEVSTRVRANGLSGASAPVYIIGDCYIAAGAAFANPGRNGVVCPPNWLAEALNYKNFVNSGCWGTMHEYNHCWQGYGLKNGGEVTNNATTLVAYSLYTRISANRTAATGWGNGSWNRFTDPSKALGELLSLGANGSIREDLSVYATLLHNIGQDMFVKAAQGGKDSGSDTYFKNLVNATHMNMSYYFTDVLHLGVGTGRGITQAAIDAVNATQYPMFVPVSSVYQVGRSIVYDGKKQYITTAQPYSYGSGDFIMSFNNLNSFAGNKFLSKTLVIPDGFTVTVKGVTQPKNGTVTNLGSNLVQYTPSSGEDGLYSGNFTVTLGITKNDGAFEVEDVDLVINLKQGTDTTMLRTTYVYDNEADVPATDAIYNSATKKFDFGKYSDTETYLNICTQETNTQIWQAGWNYDDLVYDKNSKNYRVMPNNKTLQTMEGTMYFTNPGTYRFTLKGRGKATLYLSYDNGATWEKGLTISRTSGNAYIDTEYAEHEFSTSRNYVNFKVVLLVTKESDFFGVGVAAKQADGSFSAFANAKDAFTNPEIHKQVYEDSIKKFETEYHFENNYTYTYASTESVPVTEEKLIKVSHNSWDDNQLIENLFDGKADTYYHSQQNVFITEEKPFELEVDLGKVYTLNRIVFNGYKGKIGNNGMVKSFKLYGSTDGKEYSLVTEVTDSAANAKNMTFNFDKTQIRYYKLVVTKTDNGRYFAMNSINLCYGVNIDAKGKLVAPHDTSVLYSGEWGTKNVICDFGIIYTAGAGASVEYTFTGSRVAYFADTTGDYGTVDVYIDGKLVASDVSLAAGGNPNLQYSGKLYNYFNEANGTKSGTPIYVYTGDALSDGEHVLKIVGKSGTFNVESFVCWA